jgi:hypothetical protein
LEKPRSQASAELGLLELLLMLLHELLLLVEEELLELLLILLLEEELLLLELRKGELLEWLLWHRESGPGWHFFFFVVVVVVFLLCRVPVRFLLAVVVVFVVVVVVVVRDGSPLGRGGAALKGVLHEGLVLGRQLLEPEQERFGRGAPIAREVLYDTTHATTRVHRP